MGWGVACQLCVVCEFFLWVGWIRNLEFMLFIDIYATLGCFVVRAWVLRLPDTFGCVLFDSVRFVLDGRGVFVCYTCVFS